MNPLIFLIVGGGGIAYFLLRPSKAVVVSPVTTGTTSAPSSGLNPAVIAPPSKLLNGGVSAAPNLASNLLATASPVAPSIDTSVNVDRTNLANAEASLQSDNAALAALQAQRDNTVSGQAHVAALKAKVAADTASQVRWQGIYNSDYATQQKIASALGGHS